MEILSKIAIGAAGIALFSAAAFADEVTTTTTQRTQEPGPGVYVGVPGVVGVQVGAPPSGCTTRRSFAARPIRCSTTASSSSAPSAPI
jgi:hypothetical protein